MTRPNPHIALIYHYDLARALAGEVVEWVAIPVNVDAGREGGDLCRAAADFSKRRDLFAMPAPTIAAPVPAPARPVEQPAADPEPSTASSMVPASAAEVNSDRRSGDGKTPQVGAASVPLLEGALIPGTPAAVAPLTDDRLGMYDDPERATGERGQLRVRIAGLVDVHPQAYPLLRSCWPAGVPTLKHDGHTPDQLAQILAAVRKVEAEVGAGWHPDDDPPPSARAAIARALQAWEGRDGGTAWFAASLIATFEQCRNADSTFEELVAQFSIEQCDRLYDAAPSKEHQ